MQMEEDAPSNWEGVCLSVRLAEGVNKGWVIAIKRGVWNFLVISRHLPEGDLIPKATQSADNASAIGISLAGLVHSSIVDSSSPLQ